MTHQLHSNDVRLGQTSYKFQSYPSNTNSFKWLVKGVKCKTRAHSDGFQKKKKVGASTHLRASHDMHNPGPAKVPLAAR